MEEYKKLPYRLPTMYIDEAKNTATIVGINNHLIAPNVSMEDAKYIVEACNKYPDAIKMLKLMQSKLNPNSMYYKCIDSILNK